MIEGGRIALLPPGPGAAPLLRSHPLPTPFSVPVVTHRWTASDPAGVYAVFGVLVEAGANPLDRSRWVASGIVTLTLLL